MHSGVLSPFDTLAVLSSTTMSDPSHDLPHDRGHAGGDDADGPSLRDLLRELKDLAAQVRDYSGQVVVLERQRQELELKVYQLEDENARLRGSQDHAYDSSHSNHSRGNSLESEEAYRLTASSLASMRGAQATYDRGGAGPSTSLNPLLTSPRQPSDFTHQYLVSRPDESSVTVGLAFGLPEEYLGGHTPSPDLSNHRDEYTLAEPGSVFEPPRAATPVVPGTGRVVSTSADPIYAEYEQKYTNFQRLASQKADPARLAELKANVPNWSTETRKGLKKELMSANGIVNEDLYNAQFKTRNRICNDVLLRGVRWEDQTPIRQDLAIRALEASYEPAQYCDDESRWKARELLRASQNELVVAPNRMSRQKGSTSTPKRKVAMTFSDDEGDDEAAWTPTKKHKSSAKGKGSARK